MNQRTIRVFIYRLAFEAVEKALNAGGEEAGLDVDLQMQIESQLDAEVQRLYERWARAEERLTERERRSLPRTHPR